MSKIPKQEMYSSIFSNRFILGGECKTPHRQYPKLKSNILESHYVHEEHGYECRTITFTSEVRSHYFFLSSKNIFITHQQIHQPLYNTTTFELQLSYKFPACSFTPPFYQLVGIYKWYELYTKNCELLGIQNQFKAPKIFHFHFSQL